MVWIDFHWSPSVHTIIYQAFISGGDIQAIVVFILANKFQGGANALYIAIMPIHLSELHEHIGVLLRSVSSPGGGELPKIIKPSSY